MFALTNSLVSSTRLSFRLLYFRGLRKKMKMVQPIRWWAGKTDSPSEPGDLILIPGSWVGRETIPKSSPTSIHACTHIYNKIWKCKPQKTVFRAGMARCLRGWRSLMLRPHVWHPDLQCKTDEETFSTKLFSPPLAHWHKPFLNIISMGHVCVTLL